MSSHGADIEQLGVIAVTSDASRCPRLKAYIGTNDKTPITDGHIDLYSNTGEKKDDIIGRVEIQVKGRSRQKPVKKNKPTISYAVDRADIEYFRKNGGGIYFYVPMRPDGTGEEVFFAILNPFKIERELAAQPDAAKVSFKFKRLALGGSLEGIVGLAIHQQDQGRIKGVPDSVLDDAVAIMIHTLEGFSQDRSIELTLETSDYAVLAELPSGMIIPVDADLKVFPAHFAPHETNNVIVCGNVEFSRPWASRLEADDVVLLTCSEGLRIRIREAKRTVSLSLTLAGGLRSQVRDVAFMLNAAHGMPITIDGRAGSGGEEDPAAAEKLTATKHALEGFIELFDYFGLPDEVFNSLSFNLQEKRNLLTLRDAMARHEEIRLYNGEGFGRWDVSLGEEKIITMVLPGSSDHMRYLLDPFDAANRDKFKMLGKTDGEDKYKEINWSTVYESLEVPDLVNALNLRIDQVVDAYESLEDNAVRYSLANNFALKLMMACDFTVEPRNEYLLSGAEALTNWLLDHAPEDPIHRINRWQILRRRGPLATAERQAILKLRREIASDDPSTLEACIAILLEDADDLDLVLAELTDEERKELRRWPIWSATGRER
ncbi:DUF4365 domain-containing protein [Curtobacterium flaccumfaciens]|uniref:DUF4365 domain-containing protein n=1 Tax=Curtobacterium flaccumfaciens TaxID=2035 RepID=UPI001BDEC709|nr:DUF4365 domain-containing protein [Curtobacterium flaccumfaciens]MBT1683779.1 hypothetical protein [Curtobacterium flaccumfaciens pv. flaccumfaciens]